MSKQELPMIVQDALKKLSRYESAQAIEFEDSHHCLCTDCDCTDIVLNEVAFCTYCKIVHNSSISKGNWNSLNHFEI